MDISKRELTNKHNGSEIEESILEIDSKLDKNTELANKDFELLFLLSLLEEHNQIGK